MDSYYTELNSKISEKEAQIVALWLSRKDLENRIQEAKTKCDGLAAKLKEIDSKESDTNCERPDISAELVDEWTKKVVLEDRHKDLMVTLEQMTTEINHLLFHRLHFEEFHMKK